MNIRGTDFVLYEVNDLDRGVAFYRDVLGLKFVWRNDDFKFAEFDVSQTTLALMVPEDGRKVTPGGMVFIAVDNVASAVDELRAKGVTILFGPIDTPVCEMAGILDPDGNRVGLHHRKDNTVG